MPLSRICMDEKDVFPKCISKEKEFSKVFFRLF